MAGEKAMLLSPRGIASIDWTAEDGDKPRSTGRNSLTVKKELL